MKHPKNKCNIPFENVRYIWQFLPFDWSEKCKYIQAHGLQDIVNCHFDVYRACKISLGFECFARPYGVAASKRFCEVEASDSKCEVGGSEYSANRIMYKM